MPDPNERKESGDGMTTAIYKNDACLLHAHATQHPEHPNRLRAIFKELSERAIEGIQFVDCRKAHIGELQRAHSVEYVSSLFSSIPQSEHLVNLDPDTIINCHTRDAMLAAAGAVCHAVEDVMDGKYKNAFCIIRPPGHHAKIDNFGGFCVLNNVAIGAMHALTLPNVERVAVIDFDVHHGDGTQDIFWNQEKIMFASLHEAGIFPFSGFKDETGVSSNIVNVPLAKGSTEKDMLAGIFDHIIPKIRLFEPDIILVSAGFDAHEEDPLGGLSLKSGSYRKVSDTFVELANSTSKGKIVATLEGGYNTRALAESVSEFIQGMILTPR